MSGSGMRLSEEGIRPNRSSHRGSGWEGQLWNHQKACQGMLNVATCPVTFIRPFPSGRLYFPEPVLRQLPRFASQHFTIDADCLNK
mgnify:CR=1 FL=1